MTPKDMEANLHTIIEQPKRIGAPQVAGSSLISAL